MNFKQSFLLAIKSLSTSKMRSFLTMLGIIIGVASVIILVSIVNGFKAQLVSTFEDMGTNLLTVTITSRGSTRTVDFDQMLELVDKNPKYLSGVSPSVTASGASIKFGNETSSTTSILGVSEDFAEIKNLEVTNGRFIQYVDVDRRQKNCVVGSYIAKEYFSNENPIGQTFKVNGNTLTIVGVLEEKAESEEGTEDDRIIIPYSIVRTISRVSFVNTYVFSATDKDQIAQSKQTIQDFLFSIFNSTDAYRIMSVSEMVDTVNDMTGKLTLMLVGIAGISLLVGGIGIMNIMLVSVTERTSEIGIRKSLGAKRFDIMSQFVVEAATTSSVGGIIGIIFGITVAVLICKALTLPTVISTFSVLIAFSVSVIIGVAFGYFPASKASKLNPIEALRHD